MKRLLLAALLGWALVGPAVAAIDTYQFDNDAQRDRFAELTRQLRCPKCQNQDIADSNAPIAADLRNKIHEQLLAGRSDREIVDYLVDRYGEFVLYKPTLSGRTWLLWFGPAGLLLVGGVVIAVILRRRKRAQAAGSDVLSEAERERLARLLERK